MNKKILFFDFDGTLRLEEQDRITKETYQSFEQLKQQGHLLFLNTGRSYHALGELVFTLPFDGFVCGCGTYIRYHEDVMLEAKLPDHQIVEVVQSLAAHQIEAIFEGHRGIYCNTIHSAYMKNQIAGIEKRGLSFSDPGDPNFHFVKMSVHYPNEEVRVLFEKEMAAYFDFIIRNKEETEVILKGYSKATAMKQLLAYFHLKIEDSYAFGDSNNDEEMLLAAGTSVLIGDKAKHLIEKVSFVSKCAEQDGVSYALRKLKLLYKVE